jgi:hypothetical protein
MRTIRTTMKTLVLLAALGSTGCFKSYVVVSYKQTVRVNAPAELYSTPRYAAVRGQIKTVAVRAPDECSNPTAAYLGVE